MIRAFCPKCGCYSFAYDSENKVYRCYGYGCGFIDIEKEFGEGLLTNPFSERKREEIIYE